MIIRLCTFFSRIVAEFPATGGVIPTWKFHTVKLIRYTTVSDYVVFACEIIFVLYLIYYTVEEIIEASLLHHFLCVYLLQLLHIK